MPFIPNQPTAGFQDQAEPDSVDFEVLLAGIVGDGVLSGCAITAQGTPDGTVAVASGSIRVGGTIVSVSSGNVSIPAGDATNPRFDLIVVDNAGVKSRVAGTAASNAVFPAIPASSVVLAAVYVPANDSIVNANQITDKRTFVNQAVLNAINTFAVAQKFSSYLELGEIADPTAPGANLARLFIRDNGAGLSQLCVRFPTGAIMVLATEAAPTTMVIGNISGAITTSTGAARLYNKFGRTLTIYTSWASVGTAPTGASLIVDVNKNGTTVFTTQANRPTIAVSTFFDESGAPNVTTWADGEYLSFDVDQIGSTVAGADLTVGVLVG
jgi:TolB-like protein